MNFLSDDMRTDDFMLTINEEIKKCDSIISDLTILRSKVNCGKQYLSAAKSDFMNGGYVVNEVPLCDSDFTLYFSKIDDIIESIDNMNNYYVDYKAKLSAVLRD